MKIIMVVSFWWLVLLCIISAQEPSTTIKLLDVFHTKSAGKDTIKIRFQTNLVPGTILRSEVESVVWSLSKGERRYFIHSYLMEVDKKKEVQGGITGFPWELPRGCYTLKITLSEKQRPHITKQLTKDLFGKTLLKQAIFVGDSRGLIKQHARHVEDLEDLWRFSESFFKELAKFVNLYNQGKLKAKDPAVVAWYTKEVRRMNTLRENIVFYTEPRFPGLYRESYELANRVTLSLATLAESIIFQMGVGEQDKTGPAADPGAGGTDKIDLDKDLTQLITQGKGLLPKDAIFNLCLLLKYLTSEMSLGYERIKLVVEKEKLWEKEVKAFHEALAQFDTYFLSLKKRYPDNNFQPIYETITSFQLELPKLLETYSAMVKEGETDPLKQSLQNILQRSHELFERVRQGLCQ